jgi:exosortase/archaeosortase family protein
MPAPGWRLPSVPPRLADSTRVLVAVGLIVVAYHHSLLALTAFLTSDTPVAYLGLLPLLVLGVALVKGQPRPGEGRLPHRHVDWIIGVPLLAFAGFVALALPGRLSYEFWTDRLDMLGMPFFVAGLVCVLFGARVLARVRLPIVALTLAWPLPWELGITKLLAASSQLTVGAVSLLAPPLGVAQRAADTLFTVGSGSGRFALNVAPQCAGANSALGFLLVGGAAMAVSHGGRARKLLWLLAGTVLALALNIGRILLVFWVGGHFGQRVAIEWLHPYIGLVLFAVSIVLLLVALPLFKITLPVGPRQEQPEGGRRGPARRSLTATALVAMAATTAVFGFSNHDLARFDPFLGVNSAAAYSSMASAAVRVPGMSGYRSQQIDWAKPYFGQSSTWDRYAYAPADGGHLTFLDVVETDDLRAFTRYGVEACYRFHGYQIVHVGRVDVGGPAAAQAVDYVVSGGKSWAVVSWVVPVHSGTSMRFQRAVAMRQFDSADDRGRVDADLASFARAVVKNTRPSGGAAGPATA